jgi:hypothetical protein
MLVGNKQARWADDFLRSAVRISLVGAYRTALLALVLGFFSITHGVLHTADLASGEASGGRVFHTEVTDFGVPVLDTGISVATLSMLPRGGRLGEPALADAECRSGDPEVGATRKYLYLGASSGVSYFYAPDCRLTLLAPAGDVVVHLYPQDESA